MIEISEANFESQVLQSTLPVIIEFGAEWCAPCTRLEPELEKLTNHWGGKFILAHINVDQDPDLTMQFSVMSVPTTILMKDGEEKERFIGFKPIGKIIEAFEDHID
jgi:thioredoxin 1